MSFFYHHKRSVFYVLIGALSLWACSSANTQLGSPLSILTEPTSTIVKSVTDTREYASITLDNQLEIILVSDASIEQSAVALSVGVGSFHEPREFAGLAHYLEHMLFMGTRSYPEVSGYRGFVSRNGGVQNAYTELDHTNYMLAVNNDAFDEALARFSGFFYEANLDKNYADKERNAVHSEWTMKKQDDWVILEQLNGLTLNSEHPIHNFSWGNLDSLADTETTKLHGALVEFYQKYYSANLMKATLISHLPIAEMKTLAAKHFSQIPNKNTSKPQITVAVAKPEHLNKLVSYVPQSDMKQIQIKFVISNNSAQFAVKPNTYVEYLLANEMPGTLASELRDRGWSETVYTEHNSSEYGNAGGLTLYIDLTDTGASNKDKVMGVVVKYLELIKSNGLNIKYFKEIKQMLGNRFRFKDKINDYLYAMQLAADLQKVPTEYILSHQYEYQEFSSAAIKSVLDRLHFENARVFYIGKDQPVDQNMNDFPGKYGVADINAEIKRNWDKLSKEFELNLPRTNNLMPENFDLVEAIITGKPKLLIDKKGYSVHLGHSKQFQQPKGVISFELNSGFTKQTAKNHVLANILQRALNQKLTELQSEAVVAGMQLNVTINNGLSLSISGFSEKQQELLDRAFKQLRDMELSSNELVNFIAGFTSDIHSSKKSMLFEQLFPEFRRVLNLDNFSEETLLNEAHNISPSDIKIFRDEILKRSNLQVFAFGNYTHMQVKELADSVHNQLPVNKIVEDYYLSPELNVPAEVVYSWQKNVQMSDVAMVDSYMTPLNIKDLATAQVLSQIIQPALFNQLRTEEQLAYTVGFFSQRIKEQLLLGYYIQSPVKGLAVVEQKISKFRQTFINTLENLSDKGFATNKNSVLLNLDQPAKNLQEELAEYINDWRLQNWLFDSQYKFIEAVKSVSKHDLITLYTKIENTKSFGRLVVQLRGSNFIDTEFIRPKNVVVINEIDDFHEKINQSTDER